jgi:hypothetical protein
MTNTRHAELVSASFYLWKTQTIVSTKTDSTLNVSDALTAAAIHRDSSTFLKEI